jgi:Ca2+-binding RTX toxin-like protein
MATFDINVSAGTYNGGTGNDVFNFYQRGIYLHVYGNAGDDRFNFFADMPWYFELLGGRRNTLSGGDGNDSFYGNGHTVAWLSGGAGNDLFTGFIWSNSEGAGALGGPGNDTYYVDPASPYPIIEYAGEGTDTVILTSSAPYVKPANVENVVIAGSPPPPPPPPPPNTITGDNLDNILSGGTGADSIYGLGGNDTLRGYGGDDLLDGGAGNDRLFGGVGADRLYGGDGADILRGEAGRDETWGGAGADSFIFDDAHFGGATAATCDIVHDFSAVQGDKIRLNLVDANGGLIGDQAFTFIGTSVFGHVAGQLRYEQIGGNTYVQGDTNGDALADFFIQLDGLQTLSSVDFFL